MGNEPPLDWDEGRAIILLLMRIEAKLDEILEFLLGEDDGEEEETDA